MIPLQHPSSTATPVSAGGSRSHQHPCWDPLVGQDSVTRRSVCRSNGRQLRVGRSAVEMDVVDEGNRRSVSSHVEASSQASAFQERMRVASQNPHVVSYCRSFAQLSLVRTYDLYTGSMSEAVEREEEVPQTENSHHTNNAPEATEPHDARPSLAVQNEMTGTELTDDPFLGAGMCQTVPQSLSSPLTLPDYIPLSALQDRTATETYLTHSAATQDIALDLPFTHRNGGAATDVPWSENPSWRRDDGSVSSMHPYVYGCPSRRPPSTSRFLPQSSSIVESGVLNTMNGCLPQGTVLAESSRSVRNATSSICTSQGLQRRGVSRREDLYRLSQNPWGPNTVFGQQHNVPTDMQSWQIRSGDPSYEPDCLFPSDGVAPHHLMRKDERPFSSMCAKYGGGHHGIVRRMRKRIVAVGGRLCQSFLVWVLFVATLAGVEGFKENSGEAKGLRGADVEWSDSEAGSENESQSKLDVGSFKG